jgi:hypothetical protein
MAFMALYGLICVSLGWSAKGVFDWGIEEIALQRAVALIRTQKKGESRSPPRVG